MKNKKCHNCKHSILRLSGNIVFYICKKTGRHKNFADTCDLEKPAKHPHPFLGTLDGYIEAARCRVLTDFQSEQK